MCKQLGIARAAFYKWKHRIIPPQEQVKTGKKLYLSAILDLYDRYPVAFVISGRNDNQLVFKTFDKAISANQMSSQFSIAIEVFSIQAEYFKRN